MNTNTGEQLKILTGHTIHVNSVAFSPDGNKIVSGGWDGTIRLWNAHTGELLHTLKTHKYGRYPVYSVAFSPDGNKIVSGSSDNNIRLWNAHTGELLKILTGHTSDVISVAFHPDGHTLASGSADRTIRLWNANTGELLKILTGRAHNTLNIAFSPDGNTIASGSSDNTIRLWNANTGELLKTLAGHTRDVISVAFHPDGNTLASSSWDTIRLWNTNTGELLKLFTEHTSEVNSVAFSPDGNTIASGSSDNTIHLRNTNTGELLKLLTGHGSDVNSVAFHPDGHTLASGSDDRTIRLWSTNTGVLLKILTGHKRDVNSVAFSPDGNTIASGSNDETIRLWNANTGELLYTLTRIKRYVSSVAFHSDGHTLASSSWENISLWNTGELLKTLTGHTSEVYSIAFSPDGNIIASGSDDETIRLWNTNTGEQLKILTGHTNDVISVAFSPDGNTIASGSGDGTIRLWNTNTGELLKTLAVHTYGVNSVAFHPDGHTLASGSADSTILLWELASFIDGAPRIPQVAVPDDHSNTLAEATPLFFGIDEAREGVIDSNSDVDYFEVEISQPRGVLKFYTLGGGLDAVIELQDSTGSVLPADDNIEYGDIEALRLSHEVSAGTYYVKVTGANENNTEIAYRLRAEFTPNSDDHSNTRANATPLTLSSPMGGWLSPADVDYFSVAVSSSGTLNLHIPESLDTVIELQDSTGAVIELQNGTDYTLTGAGTYYVNVTGRFVSTTGSYTLHASFTPQEDYSDDHSNTREGATPLSFGDDVHTVGEINPSSDVDYFSVEITKEGELTVYSVGSTDVVGQLQDSEGDYLTSSSNDGERQNFRIVYDVMPGTYYVKVTELNKDETGDYGVYATFTSFEGDGVKYWDLEGEVNEPARVVTYSSPSGDVLVTGDNAHRIHVFNPSTGGKAIRVFNSGDWNGIEWGDIRSIAFSPDGNWCAIGTNGKFLVWNKLKSTWADPDSWGVPFRYDRITQTVPKEGVHGVNTVRSVAFSPDSRYLAVGTEGDQVFIQKYDTELRWGKNEIVLDPVGYEENMTSVAWLPDPKRLVLATGSDDTWVRLYDLEKSGDKMLIIKHQARSPRIRSLISGGTQISADALKEEVQCLAFTPDGKKLGVGYQNGSIVIGRTAELLTQDNSLSTWLTNQQVGHSGAVLSLSFHPEGHVLASVGDDRTISFWDMNTNTFITRVEEVDEGKISSIAFHPAGNALAIGTEGAASTLGFGGSSARVYQFEYSGTTGFTNKGNFRLRLPENLISEVAYSENATYFVLNLQTPTLIDGNVANPIYDDCVITLDLPGVEQAPVTNPNGNDPRLDNPEYFMYSLETPRERIHAVGNPTGDSGFQVMTSVIGTGIGAGIGFVIGSALPGAGNIFGAGIGGFVGQLTARAIGSVTGNLIGVGLRKAGVGSQFFETPQKKAEKEEVSILSETADPFFLIQPTEDSVLVGGTGRSRDSFRILFLIEKPITEIGIMVEQAYRLEANGPLYVAKYTRTYNIQEGVWSAPSARPITLADYPPFQLLPPEEQEYLLRRFGVAMNMNAEQLQIPKETSVLPNYPNPFNPETWIPYQLAAPGDVNISIYAADGQLVRKIALGRQTAGIYQNRSRAAHWDGRNSLGEPVASGVYFYTLTAGKFTATRKMLIRK